MVVIGFDPFPCHVQSSSAALFYMFLPFFYGGSTGGFIGSLVVILGYPGEPDKHLMEAWQKHINAGRLHLPSFVLGTGTGQG
jgi:hypothetical protein